MCGRIRCSRPARFAPSGLLRSRRHVTALRLTSERRLRRVPDDLMLPASSLRTLRAAPLSAPCDCRASEATMVGTAGPARPGDPAARAPGVRRAGGRAALRARRHRDRRPPRDAAAGRPRRRGRGAHRRVRDLQLLGVRRDRDRGAADRRRRPPRARPSTAWPACGSRSRSASAWPRSGWRSAARSST